MACSSIGVAARILVASMFVPIRNASVIVLCSALYLGSFWLAY